MYKLAALLEWNADCRAASASGMAEDLSSALAMRAISISGIIETRLLPPDASRLLSQLYLARDISLPEEEIGQGLI